MQTEIRDLGVRQVRLLADERQDGEPVTRVLLLVDDPKGPTWELEGVTKLREELSRRATELGLPAVSVSLVPESDRDSAARPGR